MVYGGVDYKKQRENLTQDCDILVGTPGRLIDYLKQRVYDLDAVEILVIDEADRMFDMGFIKDLRFLLRRCPPVEERQSMLFSATLSHDVQELAFMFMNDPLRLEVKPEQVTAEGVEHHLYHVGKHEKAPFLFGLLRAETGGRTIVFVNMRRTADHLCRTFAANGLLAEQITGDIDPNAPPVLYWFRLERDGSGGARYVAEKIDDDSGVGTQVTVADLNGDKKSDVVVANKRGVFAFTQQ